MRLQVLAQRLECRLEGDALIAHLQRRPRNVRPFAPRGRLWP